MGEKIVQDKNKEGLCQFTRLQHSTCLNKNKDFKHKSPSSLKCPSHISLMRIKRKFKEGRQKCHTTAYFILVSMHWC